MKQNMAALQRANHCYRSRARLKREIKDGPVSLPAFLRSEFPEWAENMPIGDLLDAIPRLNFKVQDKMLARVPVNPLQPIGRMTIRQRNVLAKEVEKWKTKRRRERRPQTFAKQKPKVAA